MSDAFDEDLQRIKSWPFEDGWANFFKFVRTIWHIHERGIRQEGKKYSVSTDGWSGNEEIIEAMQSNAMFWSVCWESSRRGGHYEFKIPECVE